MGIKVIGRESCIEAPNILYVPKILMNMQSDFCYGIMILLIYILLYDYFVTSKRYSSKFYILTQFLPAIFSRIIVMVRQNPEIGNFRLFEFFPLKNYIIYRDFYIMNFVLDYLSKWFISNCKTIACNISLKDIA